MQVLSYAGDSENASANKMWEVFLGDEDMVGKTLK